MCGAASCCAGQANTEQRPLSPWRSPRCQPPAYITSACVAALGLSHVACGLGPQHPVTAAVPCCSMVTSVLPLTLIAAVLPWTRPERAYYVEMRTYTEHMFDKLMRFGCLQITCTPGANRVCSFRGELPLVETIGAPPARGTQNYGTKGSVTTIMQPNHQSTT